MSDLDEILGANTYDYIDFGCSKGGSLNFGQKVLGGTRGIGLDVARDKVEQTKAAGFDAAEVDVTNLIFHPNCTRFVMMMDFLEHLPGIDLAESCIKAACEAATDFIFIRQPWFDSDGYLFSKGMKLYWSDWHGHPNAMTALELHRVMSKMKKPKRWRIYARNRITDSSHPAIHPLSSPPDQHDWQKGTHSLKPKLTFDVPVYQQIGCVAYMRDDPELITSIEKASPWTDVLYDSKHE